MAGMQTGMADAEMALQEFIDALQTLILLLPGEEEGERVPTGFGAEPLSATTLAAHRTMATARQLHARLVALRRTGPR